MSTRSLDLAVIRALSAEDLPAAVRIEEASYSMPWSDETFETLLRRPDSTLLAATSAGALVGYAIGWYTLDQGELGNVAVDIPWRRRGLATRLVNEFLLRQQRLGVKDVFLEVRPSNEAARSLYARLGFVEVGLRRGYYVRPAEDAIVMRCTLRSGS